MSFAICLALRPAFALPDLTPTASPTKRVPPFPILLLACACSQASKKLLGFQELTAPFERQPELVNCNDETVDKVHFALLPSYADKDQML